MSEEPKDPIESSKEEATLEEVKARARYTHHMLWLSGIVGAVLGALLCAALIFYVVLPSRMILTDESIFGLEETVDALQKAIPQTGWNVSGVHDLCGGNFDPNLSLRPPVTLVSMCKAEYADVVLRTNPDAAAIMPCTFAVWQDQSGRTYISRMNATMMAQLFGGQVGYVLSEKVAFDEKIILGDIIKP